MSSVAPATGGITTNTAKVPGGGGPKVANGRFTINLRQSGIYIAFAVIVLGFAIATDGKLLGFQNISNIIIQNSYILVLAIGMILIIIAGHIDLSVGSVVAATGGLAAVLMVNLDIPWPLAILITLVAGGVIGAWQGYWVAYFGIPAFIVTLAGMLLFRASPCRCWATRASARSRTRSARSPTASRPARSATWRSARSAARTSSRCWSASWPAPAWSSCSSAPARRASATSSRSSRSRCSWSATCSRSWSS